MRDLSVKTLLLLPLDLVAVVLLYSGHAGLIALACLIHIAASLVAGYWFGDKGSWPGAMVPVLLLPILGLIVVFLIDNRAWIRERNTALDSVSANAKTVQPIIRHFSANDFNEASRADKSKTRELLSSMDDDAYLGLLVASRHLPDKAAYALLNEALLSPFESARLMSYSLRDKMEERLRSGLKQKLESQSSREINQAKLQLAIARDYFNLVDIGIEDPLGTALDKAAKHCVRAIQLDSASLQARQTMTKILTLKSKVSRIEGGMQLAS